MPKRRRKSVVVKKDKKNSSTSIQLRQKKKTKRKLTEEVVVVENHNDVRAFAEESQKNKKKFKMGEAATVKAVRNFVKTQTRPLLLSLKGLVRAKMVCRPSKRNRSPYVGDIMLEDGREAIAHMPCMDMGGKCKKGANLLVRIATDAKGNPVGPNAVSKKYGTRT